MNIIKVLDRQVRDQIAAGEVVSRPASVVKELVENSIDGGASRIDIEVVNGGMTTIVVSDNGDGIAPDDMLFVTMRHATSKLKYIEDLDKLATLGFRGEALASIASVSRFKLISKSRHHGSSSSMLEQDGGEAPVFGYAARADGTTVEVSDIFFNVPARRKFLKKESTEFGHIADIVEKLILSFPEIKFTLKHNLKNIYSSPGTGKLRDALWAILPAAVVGNLIEINGEIDGIAVQGYASKPGSGATDRSKEILFVNRRYIYNAALARAIEEGYRNSMERDRYPICVIFVTIDPAQVDVNVHPAKKEIKFADQAKVYNAVRNIVRVTINQKVPDPESVAVLPKDGGISDSAYIPFSVEVTGNELLPMFDAPPQPHGSREDFMKGSVLQVLNTYIVVGKADRIAIYDQHALHERIIFNRLMKRDEQVARQKLLIPEMIFLGKAELMLIAGYIDLFRDIGFEIEIFGEDCLMIRAVPDFIAEQNAGYLFSQVFADIKDNVGIEAINRSRETIYRIIACRSAIKAGDALSERMITLLLREAERSGEMATCPHGRPTMVEIGQGDLEKMFHRK